jgi:hypothetical protein
VACHLQAAASPSTAARAAHTAAWRAASLTPPGKTHALAARRISPVLPARVDRRMDRHAATSSDGPTRPLAAPLATLTELETIMPSAPSVKIPARACSTHSAAKWRPTHSASLDSEGGTARNAQTASLRPLHSSTSKSENSACSSPPWMWSRFVRVLWTPSSQEDAALTRNSELCSTGLLPLRQTPRSSAWTAV